MATARRTRAEQPVSGAASGRVLILLAALFFSTGGAAIKLAGLDGWQIAGLRSGVAFLALWLFLPAGRRGWTWRSFLVGIAYAATLICYVVANRLTTAANVIFLQSTAPLYILALAPWLLKERTRRADLWFMAAIAIGLVSFFVSGQEALHTAPDPRAGNLLAATAGLFWACTIVGLRWLGKQRQGRENPIAAVVLGNAIAFVACLPRTFPLADVSAADILVVLYLGIVQVSLAYLFLTYGLRLVPAFEASLLGLIELVLNPLWAWWIHAERPASTALFGGGVIVLACAAKSFYEGRRSLPMGGSAAGQF